MQHQHDVKIRQKRTSILQNQDIFTTSKVSVLINNPLPKVSNVLPGGEGVLPEKNWVGVCGLLPKTLTLFMTKICDFPYPIYDLTKNLIPYL